MQAAGPCNPWFLWQTTHISPTEAGPILRDCEGLANQAVDSVCRHLSLGCYALTLRGTYVDKCGCPSSAAVVCELIVEAVADCRDTGTIVWQAEIHRCAGSVSLISRP